MLSSNQVLERCIRWGIIANFTEEKDGSKASAPAYCKFHTLQQVLELPYSKSCKGLTVEEIETYCKEVSQLIIKDNLCLQETLNNLDVGKFQDKLK